MKPLLQPEQWVAKYTEGLYRYALSRLNDVELARDIVQETFLSALKAAANFQGRSTEKTWLYAILRNKIIDQYRARNKYRKVSITSNDDREVESLFFNNAGKWREDEMPKEWADTELRKKEFYQILQACFKKLKPRHADIFAMKYLEGLHSDKICKTMNITPSNYWVIIHRAKLVLRACMEKHWLDN